MHHSGLFERFRVHLVTAVSWWAGGPGTEDLDIGGKFPFHPNGPRQAASINPARFNTAAVLDTDSVFHGVDRVHGRRGGEAPPPYELAGRSVKLVRAKAAGAQAGSVQWDVVDANTKEKLDKVEWGDIRLSISWKAYVFDDDAARDVWLHHTDDLDMPTVWRTIKRDLREQHGWSEERLGQTFADPLVLALELAETYIPLPRPPRSLWDSLKSANWCIVAKTPSRLCPW